MNFSETIVPVAGEVIVIDDPRELDGTSRLSQRLPRDLAMVRYAIHDRRLLQTPTHAPVSTHSRIHANGIYVTRIVDRFQTEMDIGGAGLARYWFGLANAGSMVVEQGTRRIVAERATGIALLGRPGTRLLSSDRSVRTNLWIDATVVEHALSTMLGDRLHRPLEFRMEVDWNAGLAASLRRQIGYFTAEMRRPDGLATNPVALASLTDLLLQTLLLALPHSYSDRLGPRPTEVAPGILTRAEDYMRAHAAEAMRLEHVARAAGCSVRTLSAVYARLRQTTPLGALREIRLGNARAELMRSDKTSIVAMAQRHGFANAGRFAACYRTRYGELPSETQARR